MKESFLNRGKKYIPGMRIIKSALSVTICILIANIIFNKTSIEITGFYAGIAALFTLEGTFAESKNKGKSRVIGTLIGGSVALCIYYFNVHLTNNNFEVIFIFIGIIIAIQLCNVTNNQAGTMAAGVAFLASMTISADNYEFYILIRTLETMYGVCVALVVNKYFFPYEKKKTKI